MGTLESFGYGMTVISCVALFLIGFIGFGAIGATNNEYKNVEKVTNFEKFETDYSTIIYINDETDPLVFDKAKNIAYLSDSNAVIYRITTYNMYKQVNKVSYVLPEQLKDYNDLKDLE
ncbi:hypothetical protein M0Q97_11890 [Candidatus Dojkabacteria bacterium]|jgi:hypothetical protein|nr:hypothetical protein [Candidatus Dojkabacteria bacterium]